MILTNCSASSFLQNVRERNIICFGASNSTAKVIVEQFIGENIEDKLLFFVDNDSNKWGKKIEIANKEYDVFSPEILKEQCYDNICIFITSRFWDEIIQQLNEYDTLKNTRCYIYFLFSFCEKVQKINVKTKKIPVIPKTIHYCWFGEGKMPEDVLICIDSWKHYLPDYKILLWNEKNYDVKQNFFLKEAYEKKLWNCICDYARFDIIYQYGGIYLDTDVELVKSFDDLLFNDSFWGRDTGGQAVNTGVGFGAVKNNKFVCEHLMEYKKYSDQKTPLKYTDGSWNLDILAPCVTTRLFLQHGLHLIDETQVIDDAIVYSSEVMSPSLQIPTSNTYSIHKCSSTWSFNDDEMQKRWDKQKDYYYYLIKEGKIKFE